MHIFTLCGVSTGPGRAGSQCPRLRETYPDRLYLTRRISKHSQSKNGQIDTLQRTLESARLAGQNKYKNVAELLLWRQAGAGRWSFGVSGSVVAQDWIMEEDEAPVQSLLASGVTPSPGSRPAGPAQALPFAATCLSLPPWSNFLPSYLSNLHPSTFSRLFSCFTPELRLAGHRFANQQHANREAQSQAKICLVIPC